MWWRREQGLATRYPGPLSRPRPAQLCSSPAFTNFQNPACAVVLPPPPRTCAARMHAVCGATAGAVTESFRGQR